MLPLIIMTSQNYFQQTEMQTESTDLHSCYLHYYYYTGMHHEGIILLNGIVIVAEHFDQPPWK